MGDNSEAAGRAWPGGEGTGRRGEAPRIGGGLFSFIRFLYFKAQAGNLGSRGPWLLASCGTFLETSKSQL